MASHEENNRKGGQELFWSDLCKSGELFSVSRKFCLENQKQLNKSLRTTAEVRNHSCWFSELFCFSFSFPGLDNSQRLAETSCQLVNGQMAVIYRKGPGGRLKEKLQRHLIVPISQSLELGGTNTVRGVVPGLEVRLERSPGRISCPETCHSPNASSWSPSHDLEKELFVPFLYLFTPINDPF